MTEKVRIPQIRFKGFTDPWEQRKLGDLGSVSMCRRIFKHQHSILLWLAIKEKASIKVSDILLLSTKESSAFFS